MQSPQKKAQARASKMNKAPDFFKNIMKQSSMRKKEGDSTTASQQSFTENKPLSRMSTMMGPSQMAQGSYSDEFVTRVIQELQKDKAELQMKEHKLRFAKLQQADGAFNKFVKNSKRNAEAKLKLKHSEQQVVENAIHKTMNAKKELKLQLSKVRVVDLEDQKVLPSKEKEQQLVQEARESLRQADKVLFNGRPAAEAAPLEPELEVGALKLLKPVKLNRERLLLTQETARMFGSLLKA